MTKTNRLKELRKSKGYTLDDISELTGITRGTYNNYENGKTEPKLAVWKQLSEFYGVSIMELMDPEDFMNSIRKSANSIRSTNNEQIANQIKRIDQIIKNEPMPQTSADIFKSLDVMLKIFDYSNFDDFELDSKIQERYSDVLDCLMVLLHADKDTDEEDRQETNKMISKAELDFSHLLSLLLEAQNKKASDD
ncbi:helix-turn-helix domain-containing protein [Leuconostoc suionicum]|uniref:helix-turn-helix domain-containing protein n=1 Tax=Leuconostoc suionicum TaxID=1511761 RepID=UPI0024AE233E|nr:helix-turn-helix domain-containing protein [Leuconostoc suionicum]MDI6550071.1 helix-turn-helix domain-containing protein [Leuconostoc suionicum]